MSAGGYGAVLVVSFGGPERAEDVIPFLENVVRGRGVSRDRLLEVAEHYYSFSGGNRNGLLTSLISVIYMIPNAVFPTCSPTHCSAEGGSLGSRAQGLGYRSSAGNSSEGSPGWRQSSRHLSAERHFDPKGGCGAAAHSPFHGSEMSIPASSKSRTLRVATAMSRDRAIAAIWQSATGIGRPTRRRAAAISA